MVAKFNFKTVYKNGITTFWAILCAFTIKVLKSANMIQKIILCTNSIWVSKRRILCWFWIGRKNCKTFHKKKAINKNVTEICTFFTLLMFFKFVSPLIFFSTDLKPAQKSAFFHTHNEFVSNNFFGQISTYCKLWSRTRTKELKSLQTCFVNMCREVQSTHHKVFLFISIKFVVP